MKILQDQRLFSLTEFLVFSQAVGERVEAEVPGSLMEITASAELAEAILWLQWGLDLDFYSPPEGYHLMRRMGDQLKPRMSRYARQLEELIPPALFLGLRAFVNGGDLMHDQKRGNKTPVVEIIPYFQMGLALARRMNGDLLGRQFRAQLVLASEENWKGTLENSLNIELVRRLYAGEVNAKELSAESLIAGYFRTLDAMALWGRLFETIRTDLATEPGLRSLASRTLGQITSWRLHLHEQVTKLRFKGVARIADGVLEYTAAVTSGQRLERSMSLSEQVDQLIRDWLSNHPYELSYGAGS